MNVSVLRFKKFVQIAAVASLFCAATVFSSGDLRAQVVVYQHVGFQQSAGLYSPLNYAIRRYNETRDWLDKDMSQFHFPNGLAFGAGCVFNRVLVDVCRRGGTSLVSATGTDATGDNMQRDLRCRISSIGIGAGYSLSGRGSPATLAGLSLDVTSVKTWTRVAQQDAIRFKDLVLIQNEVSPSLTLFFQKQLAFTESVGLVVRPWVSVPLRTLDFYPTHDALNHATAADDPVSDQKGMMISAGVTLSLGLFLHL